MGKGGDFPRRFNLTLRCLMRDLEEVEAWLEERRVPSSVAIWSDRQMV